jgi:hypothetical protein
MNIPSNESKRREMGCGMKSALEIVNSGQPVDDDRLMDMVLPDTCPDYHGMIVDATIPPGLISSDRIDERTRKMLNTTKGVLKELLKKEEDRDRFMDMRDKASERIETTLGPELYRELVTESPEYRYMIKLFTKSNEDFKKVKDRSKVRCNWCGRTCPPIKCSCNINHYCNEVCKSNDWKRHRRHQKHMTYN